eukprot:7002813-Prymnesium_polylepis.1
MCVTVPYVRVRAVSVGCVACGCGRPRARAGCRCVDCCVSVARPRHVPRPRSTSRRPVKHTHSVYEPRGQNLKQLVTLSWQDTPPATGGAVQFPG